MQVEHYVIQAEVSQDTETDVTGVKAYEKAM
jgi:hypothetical protein